MISGFQIERLRLRSPLQRVHSSYPKITFSVPDPFLLVERLSQGIWRYTKPFVTLEIW